MLYLVVAVLAASAVAYTLAKRDDTVGRSLEKFAADRAPKYEVGGTVSIVAAYREVYGESPDPKEVREAYDDMVGMGLKIDRESAARFFRERRRISEEGKGGRSEPRERASSSEIQSEGDSDRGGHSDSDRGGQRERALRAPATEERGDERFAASEGPGTDSDESEDETESTEGDGGGERGRGDPFLSSVAAELDAMRRRLEALATRVGEKAEGAGPFSGKASLRTARGRDLTAGPVRAGGTRPAAALFDQRDNDSADEASLRTARAVAGSSSSSKGGGPMPAENVVEGFYSPW